jgi:hypothetical protein
MLSRGSSQWKAGVRFDCGSVLRFNWSCNANTAERFSRVLGMLSSLEVKVLPPNLMEVKG